MKKKVYVVNHTHWDREWYFTTMDSLMLSDDVFNQAIEELEHNPEAKFVLDGQSSILDEYMALHPEQIDRVRQLVASGQLAIGPWYTQTDAFAVNEESFLHNLAIGTREARKYGHEMEVGYLPDTFGFNAQMPTLLKAAGFDNIVFWRGINFKTQISGPYFKWRGLGDKSVTAANLVDGYGTAAFINDSDEYIKERLLPAVARITALTDAKDILIPAGGDQLKIVTDLPEKLQTISEKTDYDFVEARYEDFLETLDPEQLPEYRGEFREPVSTRVHKTIGSVRYDIKKESYDLEQLLLRHVEPLLAIAAANGIRISSRLVVTAWKKLLEGQAHDSMGGCVEDVVAIDILHRFKEARELAEGLENTVGKRLAEKMGLSQDEVIIFNTSAKPFSGYKVIDILAPSTEIGVEGDATATVVSSEAFAGKDNLLLETPEGPKYINEKPYYRVKILTKCQVPAMGFKVVKLAKRSAKLEDLVATDQEISQGETTVSFSNGQLTLRQGNVTLSDFLVIQDDGNDGDTYDFSPLRGDKPLNLRFEQAVVTKSVCQQVMTLAGKFELPVDLSQRLAHQPTTKSITMTLTITLREGQDLPSFHLTVDNKVFDHRLRLKVALGETPEHAIASVPFGFLQRPVNQPIPKDWAKQYVEYPIDIEIFDKLVALQGKSKTVTVYGQGLKEYQVIDSDLYVTLMATTGQLGKPNLVYRPGRASGDTTKKGHVMIPTPMAELQQTLVFDFAIGINSGAFDEANASRLWRSYTEPDISYQAQSLNMFIHRLDSKLQPENVQTTKKNEFSLLSYTGQALTSSLTPSLYDQNAWILRLVNPTGEAIDLGMIDSSKFRHCRYVDAREQAAPIVTQIAPYDCVAIKLWA